MTGNALAKIKTTKSTGRQNTKRKMKNLASQTRLKTNSELKYSGKARSYCFTSGTRRVTLVNIPVIRWHGMCQFNLEDFVVSYPIIVTHNTIIRLDIALCQASRITRVQSDRARVIIAFQLCVSLEQTRRHLNRMICYGWYRWTKWSLSC
jgi:hypothetical protein